MALSIEHRPSLAVTGPIERAIARMVRRDASAQSVANRAPCRQHAFLTQQFYPWICYPLPCWAPSTPCARQYAPGTLYYDRSDATARRNSWQHSYNFQSCAEIPRILPRKCQDQLAEGKPMVEEERPKNATQTHRHPSRKYLW